MNITLIVDVILGFLVGWALFAHGVSTEAVIGLIAFLMYIFTRKL